MTTAPIHHAQAPSQVVSGRSRRKMARVWTTVLSLPPRDAAITP